MKKLSGNVFAALLFLLGSGCTALHPGIVKTEISRKEAAPFPGKVKSSVSGDYLIPQMAPPVPVPSRKEETFRIMAQKTPVREVLMVLARDSRYNIIVDPDIHASVTVDLKGATMAEALDAVLSPLHLKYRIRGKTIRVFRPKMETRIFTLNYITSSRIGKTLLSVSSGGKSGTTGQSGQQDTSEGDSGTVRTESKADLWEEIRKGLQAIVPEKGEGGSSGRLVLNELSGTVLVTAYPEQLKEVEDFLEAIEGSIQRQVMITAKIVEVTLSDSNKMGIDWAGIPNLRGSFVGNLTSGLAATQPEPASVVQKLSPGTGFFQIGATKGDISVLLDMIATQGKLHVLASPRIATLNNQKAIIKAGREDSFFTLNKETNSEGGVLQENLSVEREDYTIGVVLDVTPQISSNGTIIMNIHPSITDFVEEKTFPPGAVGSDILANAPVLDVREVDTIVRIQTGETIVIAGLMKRKQNRKVTSVPFFGDLPVLGRLFQRVETENENVELVILLKPEVVAGRSHREFSGETLPPDTVRWGKDEGM